MAYTDFDFYKNEYKGIVIDDSNKYAYFAERASEELALFAYKLPIYDEAQTALKKCECKIADILFGDFQTSKNGNKITSESVSGYYSVSYATTDKATIKKDINSAIKLYLGKWILGARAVRW